MSARNITTSQTLIEDARNSGAPLTTALRTLNRHFGYIDDKTIPELAHAYSRSRAEVLGVISYYCDGVDGSCSIRRRNAP
jgi:NADH:ubiquinone oxidoreductase subunit E